MNREKSDRNATEIARPVSAPISYLERTRAYYLALGYETPYVWARQDHVPFTPLAAPLTKTRVTLVTTAAPYQPDKGDQGPGAPYNARAKFFTVYSGDTRYDHDVRIAHVAIDRKHTHMEDSGSWFPLPAMRKLASSGRFILAPRFHGFPTNRSQRQTATVDAPELLARCQEDGVQAAVLVANCPVCHQCLAIAARRLEENGVSTVLLGCARDIVELCGAPRFLFSDFPLGNAAGRPHDPASQKITLKLALKLLVNADAPRTIWQSPLLWSESAEWKLDYANPERLSSAELADLRAKAEAARIEARALRKAALTNQAAREQTPEKISI
ncbi:MAG: hypothetical protein LBG69_05475 [Zoogloeaceae bacterium]|jgi:hypothetical protein|nr:hypothetical protein [Zoogloeaceae bacterium]